MISNINTYPNLQFNPFPIPEFTVIEIYRDTIAKDNSLGYCILPIEGLDDAQIETKIRTLVDGSKPEEYQNLAVLNKGYNHKICYAVWYTDTAPEFPKEPSPQPMPEPAAPFNVWEEIVVDNPGQTVPLALEITCSSFTEPIGFYINDVLFSITIGKPQAGINVIVADRTGASYNNKGIDTFDFPTTPVLKNGRNVLKFNKTNVSAVKVRYTQKF